MTRWENDELHEACLAGFRLFEGTRVVSIRRRVVGLRLFGPVGVLSGQGRRRLGLVLVLSVMVAGLPVVAVVGGVLGRLPSAAAAVLPVAPVAPVQRSTIAAGGIVSVGFSVVVASDATVWAWGDNGLGELANPAAYLGGPTPVKVQVLGGGLLSGVVAVAAGSQHGLALKSDGTVWAWGFNSDGELGNGTFSSQSNVAVEVLVSAGTALSGVVGVAGGGRHSVAVRADGTVWAWGYDGDGELGDNGASGSHSAYAVPVQVSGVGGLSGVAAVAGGDSHSLALKSDGTVWAWGLNSNGQLGDGYMLTRRFAVEVMASGGPLGGVVSIAGGYRHSLATGADGSLWAWGDNGSLWAWGDNAHGELGDGTMNPSLVSERVPTGFKFVSVGAGAEAQFSLAVEVIGRADSWGMNTDGQLGAGPGPDAKSPELVVGVGQNGGVTAVAGGSDHSLILRSDTAMVSASGSNGVGQLGTTVDYHSGSPFALRSTVTQVATIPTLFEQLGDANPSEMATSCATASGVNCVTGSLSISRVDVSVATRGVPLAFVRTYNSRAIAASKGFGYGLWTNNFAVSVSGDQDGSATVTQENGSTVGFAPDGNGGWVPPSRVFATLTSDSTGFIFERKHDLIRFKFTPAGQLQSETDRNVERRSGSGWRRHAG